jgi:hypothetical protein
MNEKKLVASILGAATLASLVTSSAFAGVCSVRIRNYPTSGADIATLACRRNSGAATNGVVKASILNGVKTLSANLQTGANITIQGLTSDGFLIAACTVTDSSPGGAAVTGTCNSAAKWVAKINFAD